MIVASFGVLYLRSEFVGHLDQRGRCWLRVVPLRLA
jgi:hypothetical protein